MVTKNTSDEQLDLLLINPGGREEIYQELGAELSAVEPPLWCRLIAGYVRDRDLSVAILDAEALKIGPAEIAKEVRAANPRLIGMIVFGHQPSASTQQMAGAGAACRAIKDDAPDYSIIMVGGHVSALPERTLVEEPIDYACKGEGPITVVQLLEALKTGETEDLSTVEGLVWTRDDKIVVNPSAALITSLDKDLHGNAWDLLPMEKYRAHNWQSFGDLGSREPYA
ncbi:MAG: cobalamin B12-binding domain-containing protein, partial [Rhodospirillales bacterium]|nr:cobalamin B12-binding domain-containing protein [Rhodospirillales bacterium]